MGIQQILKTQAVRWSKALAVTTTITGLTLLASPGKLIAAEFAGKLNSVSITDAAGANTPPAASFTYTKNGDTYSFDASASTDPDGSITEYKWDFGDGTKGTGSNVTHTFGGSLDPIVTLTVIDDNSAVTLNQQTIVTAECEQTPFLDVTEQDGSVQLITHDYYTFTGGQYTGTDFLLCKASFRISAWVGDISNKEYEVRVYSPNGTTLGSLKPNGVSSSLQGADIIKDTNTYYEFTFEAPVQVSTNDMIVITESTGAQSVDTANFVRVYRSSNVDTAMNFGTWKSSGEKSSLYGTLSPSTKLYKINQ